MKGWRILGAAFIVGGGVLALIGCESANPPSGTKASQVNTSESAPYTPGTGVGSSSFDRHPRFYTGDSEGASAPPTTRPAEAQ